ncbi:hypothetical protein [Legionella spiritensis]|uniref:Uncharacterized protein n=1 Tax=Legionella spiritensis TaxID=452 RepID=A0A0W0Z6D6_LEGSP|nr:hypothetical protein [Legionella spiritensis]KTD64278.1 hypothetical protein Lspi_1085 [Legionella spiritensis]SNV46957.1 Uncharacterised protein [Legionella spiritensis]
MQEKNEASGMLNRAAFFANGASIDHGNHIHKFLMHDDHAHALTIVEDEVLVSVEDKKMSKEEAFTVYTALMNPIEDAMMLSMALLLMNALVELDASNESEYSSSSSESESESESEDEDLNLDALFNPRASF